MSGDSGPAFELKLFGGFDLRRTNGGRCRVTSRKAKALLGYLALRHDRPSTRDKLAGLLWDWLDPVSARNNLRQVLFAIRQQAQFSDNFLLVAGDGLRLNEAVFRVDVWQFETLLAESTPEALGSACRLYGGDLFDGLHFREIAFEDWLMRERERFRRAALSAIGQVLEHSLAADDTEAAQEAAMGILAIDPVDESAHRALMSIYARKHRYALALRQYELCRETLKRELSVEPEMETRYLHFEIVRSRLKAAGPEVHVAESLAMPQPSGR
jgi:DNA-binding SARP family transcriptional activator